MCTTSPSCTTTKLPSSLAFGILLGEVAERSYDIPSDLLFSEAAERNYDTPPDLLLGEAAERKYNTSPVVGKGVSAELCQGCWGCQLNCVRAVGGVS